MKLNLLALSALLGLAAAATETTTSDNAVVTLSPEAKCAERCKFHTRLRRSTIVSDSLQAMPGTAAASRPATVSPAQATARPTRPTAASPLAPRVTARPPTPRSSPTVSRIATARTSSPEPLGVPLPPRPARLVPSLLASPPPRLAPQRAPRPVSSVGFLSILMPLIRMLMTYCSLFRWRQQHR